LTGLPKYVGEIRSLQHEKVNDYFQCGSRIINQLIRPLFVRNQHGCQ